jgi:formate hydrogenlyase subunit 3/multisubunit Na+/H+ antiporter MnhD subunit
LSAIYLKEALFKLGHRTMAVLLVAIMALCGVILTRDVFNLFVFFELVVISTAGLVLLSEDDRALSAGFKYLIVSQVISVLLLVGIIFAYHATGTLNIDGMAEATLTLRNGGMIAFFLMFIAVSAELKPFPANGWALDIYESAHPAFSAIFSAATGAAALYAVDKMLLIGGSQWLPMATGIGLLTFIAANLFALAQINDRRLMGYSSIAQTGLVLVAMGQRDILGDATAFVAFGLLISHAIAKAGLFWLSGLVAGRKLTDWTTLRGRPLLIFAFVTFIAMLSGLPPFPGFYAKWELVRVLAGEGRLWLLGLGAFWRASGGWLPVPLVRLHHQARADCGACRLCAHRTLPIFVALLSGWGLGFVWGNLSGQGNLMLSLPLMFALVFLLLDWLPAWVKNIIAIGGMSAFFLFDLGRLHPAAADFCHHLPDWWSDHLVGQL